MSIFGNLDGKVALVCGASQGLGAAIAEALANLGAQIIAVARSEESLASLVQRLPHPSRHRAYVLDLSDLDAVAHFSSKISSTHAPHILVNNTGGPAPSSAVETSIASMMQGLNTHLLANMILTQAFIPKMKEYEFGRIINVVSVSARNPVANLAVSNTVRGAVLNWAKTLSRELAPFGITVNSVLPGYTNTTRLQEIINNTSEKCGLQKSAVEQKLIAEIPMGRFGLPEEIAAAVAYLASPAASFTTGTTIAVDGGWTNAT